MSLDLPSRNMLRHHEYGNANALARLRHYHARGLQGKGVAEERRPQ